MSLNECFKVSTQSRGVKDEVYVLCVCENVSKRSHYLKKKKRKKKEKEPVWHQKQVKFNERNG